LTVFEYNSISTEYLSSESGVRGEESTGVCPVEFVDPTLVLMQQRVAPVPGKVPLELPSSNFPSFACAHLSRHPGSGSLSGSPWIIAPGFNSTSISLLDSFESFVIFLCQSG